MSEAPETVWIDTDGYWSAFDPSAARDVVDQYTRSDLCVTRADLDAAVALALEEADRECRRAARVTDSPNAQFELYKTADAIRALIQPHQADALARVRHEAHNAAREVKPLVWKPHPFSQSTIEECAIADAPFSHRYQVQRDPWASTYIAYLHPTQPITDSTLWWESKGHSDIEAAKAAAQADHTARIHSALALPVDGGAGE